MKYYYTYTIMFDDGCYYYGSRISNVPPEQDFLYVGSPVTNKNKWSNCKYVKKINEEYSSYEDMIDGEKKLIGNDYRKDEKCLNAHNTENFGCYGAKWYFKYENEKLVETLFKVPPDSSWSLGRPSTIVLNTNQEKRKKTSKSLKNKKMAESHRKKISEASKKRYEDGIFLNPMSIPNVKEKHSKILDTKEYRKKVSEGVKNSNRWTEEKKEKHKVLMREKLKSNNPVSKKVNVNGVEYLSIQDAMNSTGMSRKEIKKVGIFI